MQIQDWKTGSDNVYASCRFCGRFVTEENAQKLPLFMSIYVGRNNTPKVIVVADSIWCGECRPQAEPIEMPELF